jgi:hypothetical protein
VVPARTEAPPADPGRLAAPDRESAVARRRADEFRQLWSRGDAILSLAEPLSTAARAAESLALAEPRIAAWVRDPATGQPFRTEVLAVRTVAAGDITPRTSRCDTAACYRVDIYNHAAQESTVAVVDADAEEVLTVDVYPGLQPAVPPHLARLAAEIAAAAPEVAAELGAAPHADEARMAETKSALNKTRCERSRHLCVAPTFVQGDRALWAIVDLTDGVLVGTRWTDLGRTAGGAGVTQRSLEDAVVADEYCAKGKRVQRDGWEMDLVLTSSDGLRLSDVKFRGVPVVDSVKLVDWHVSYSGVDAFGYSDAIGCPTFGQAAVVAHAGPQVEDLESTEGVTGFRITQDFVGPDWPAPCQYYYRQQFDFGANGQFYVAAANLGRGCGSSGTYRPVLRIDLGVDGATIAGWDGGQWHRWHEENFVALTNGTVSSDGHSHRISGRANEYFVSPVRQPIEGDDNEDGGHLFVTRRHADRDEGDADLITIGPCCNADHRQGPEVFMAPHPESLTGADLVLWYVPRLAASDRPGAQSCWADVVLVDGLYEARPYPCEAGLRFDPSP